jgi:N-acetylmuramoyl-L-alanine amidase
MKKNSVAFPLWLLTAAVLVFGAGGCATVPRLPAGFGYATQTIDGATYFPVIRMCEKEGVLWDYDPLSQVLVLKKGGQEVRSMIGSRSVRLGNENKLLSAPLCLKDSVVYAPVDLWSYFQPAVQAPATPSSGAARLRSVRTVIIDAGHGGKDPGAIGRAGLREKDVVLDVAQRVRQALDARGLRAYLTRDTDDFIVLGQRPEQANNKDADIFVSIHANANPSRRIEGFEAYYLTEAVDDAARAVAAAENAPADIDADFFRDQMLSLKAMLWDLVYTENRKEAVTLGHYIGRSVSRQTGLKLLGVKGAPFAVLKGAKMPAVLLEIGYISNRDGERRFRDPNYRQRLAEAIADGIMDFKRYAEGSR